MNGAEHFIAAILFLLVRLEELHSVQDEPEHPDHEDGERDENCDRDLRRQVNERGDLVARGQHHECEVHNRQEALAQIESKLLPSQHGSEFHK